MNRRAMLVALILFPFLSLQAQQARSTDEWKDFEFLFGEWTWVGGGKPGQGNGMSTFRPELDGTVLVRKTHLDYPATKERAAFGHDDLIYVYHDPQDNSLRAIFFDGEGHVIRSEEHTSELQSPCNFVCRLLLEKKKTSSFTVSHTPAALRPLRSLGGYR